MNVHGIGIDVVEIARIERLLERHEERFEERVFTAAEREYCRAHRVPAPRFAARFAAKEAVAKAFGTGIGKDLEWLDMEVGHDAAGAPVLHLEGAGAVYAEKRGITGVLISLTHAEHYAAANAVALTE